MLREIYPGIFYAFLLICLCHSARLNGSSDEESLVNTTNNRDVQRRGKCFGKIYQWITGGSVVSVDPDNVRFYLYPHPYQPTYPEEITFQDVGNLKRLHFRSELPWKFIIHGFTTNYVSASVQRIKDAYLQRMAQNLAQGSNFGYNVVIVDWEALGNPKTEEDLDNLFYRDAVRNIPVVGQRIAEVVDFLMEHDAITNLDNLHIIGFSLGAHVAGYAGYVINSIVGQAPIRVTGLDPAGPAFYDEVEFSHRHLQNTDGRFVDVIHSNKGALGILDDIGHVDFHPNGGGPVQWQCENKTHNNGAAKLKEELVAMNSCSHNKAPEYFALSILNPSMFACKCSSYKSFKTTCGCPESAIFGEYCDPRTRGKFYLSI